jgi:hypothetical protein
MQDTSAGTATGTLNGQVTGSVNPISVVSKDISVNCAFNLQGGNYNGNYGVSGTWTSNSDLLGTAGTIDFPSGSWSTGLYVGIEGTFVSNKGITGKIIFDSYGAGRR